MSRILVVYSGDRNRDFFPSTNKFIVDSSIINFNEYRNNFTVKIKRVILPSIALSIPYLTMTISEIDTTIDGTNSDLNRAFCILIPKPNVTGTLFTEYTAELTDNKLNHNLHKLSISFFAPDGTMFDFGSDTAPGTPVTGSVQTTIIFEISE